MSNNWIRNLVDWKKSAKEVEKKADDTELDTHMDTYEADGDDLVMLVENEQDLYKNSLMPMYENLTRKKLRGVYNKALAPKLFMYVVTEAAKRWYDRMVQWADDGKSIVKPVSREAKEQAAQELTERFESAFEYKEYDFMTELEDKYVKRMPKKDMGKAETEEIAKESARPPKPTDQLSPDEEYVFDENTQAWVKTIKKI